MFRYRAYTKDVCNEIKSISSPEQLQKIALKLVDENNQLVRQCHKQRSALAQIHLLEEKLYLTLQNKMSETRLLKKCLAISQYSKDKFLKKVVIPGLTTFDDECQKIFSSLSREPSILFLSQAMVSATSNLQIVKLVVKYYLENCNNNSDLHEKPQLQECLGYIKKILKLIEKMKHFNIFGGSNGSKRRRQQANNSMENNAVKRRKLQGYSGPVTAVNKKINVQISRSENFAEQTLVPMNNAEHSSGDFMHSRRLVVKLIDVLKFPSQSESDLDVLHFKQTNLIKDNEDNGFNDLDDVGESHEEAASNVELSSCNPSSKLYVDDANNSGSNVHSEGGEIEEQELTTVIEVPIKEILLKPMEEGEDQERNLTEAASGGNSSFQQDSKSKMQDKQAKMQNKQEKIQNKPDKIQNKPDKIQNKPDKMQNKPDKMQNKPDKMQNKQDKMQNKPDKMQNKPDKMQNKPDKMQNKQDKMQNKQKIKTPQPSPPKSRNELFFDIFGLPIIRVKDVAESTATQQQGNTSTKS